MLVAPFVVQQSLTGQTAMNDEVNLETLLGNSTEMKSFIDRSELKFLQNRKGNFNGYLRNLFLTIYPTDGKLRVVNSLHKFYKGENYSTFTRRENELALGEFEELIKIPLEKFQVHSIAVGLNIRVNELPESYLNIPYSYKTKKFDITTISKNRIVKSNCNLNELKIKFYNKSYQFNKERKFFEPKLENPFLLRFETAFCRMRRIPKELKRAPQTAKELFTERFISAMAKNQLQLFETIVKKSEMDFSKLTPEELKIISVMENENLEKGFKEFHPHTFKKDRLKFLKLKKTIQFTDSKIKELREKFRDETEKILSN